MDVKDVTGEIRDALSVKRVFGEPYEEDGVKIIPVAKFMGGAGGGGGEGADQGKGFGSGFGLNARPAGVYVIRDGTVSWRPAVDVNRIVLGGQVVAVDAVGVGPGELVLVATGSSARQTLATKDRPCDAVIMAIVDSWEIGGTEKYRKD